MIRRRDRVDEYVRQANRLTEDRAAALADPAAYSVGSRLLVSGNPIDAGPRPDAVVAWSCGFTRWYNPTEAQEWERTFREPAPPR